MKKSKKSSRILWLDTLKALACLIVFTAHVLARYPETVSYSHGVGKIGVWLFMVASGYLLMATAPKELNIKWLIKYYINKVIKIYPGLVLGVYLTYKAGIITESTEIKSALLTLTGPAHLWYVPVILRFYLVAPLIIFVEKKVESRLVKFIGFLSVGVAFSIIWSIFEDAHNSVELKYYMPILLLGVLIYYIPTREWKHRFIWDIITVIAAVAIILITPYCRIELFHYDNPEFIYNKKLFIAFIWSVIIISMLQGAYTRTVLDKCYPLHLLATINYPFYVIHYPIIYILLDRYGFTEWKMYIIAFIVTVAISVVFYFVIDKPLSFLVRKIFSENLKSKNESD